MKERVCPLKINRWCF